MDNNYKDLIWSAAESKYKYEKEEFNANWKTMKIIYYVLLALGIIPGLLYSWIFYGTKEAKNERSKSANRLVYKAINKLDKVDSRIEKINAHGVNQTYPDRIKLPYGKINTIKHNFQYMKDPRQRWVVRFETNENRTSPYIAEQLEASGILQELTGRRDGAMGFAAKHLGNTGKLLSRDALVSTNAVASIKLKSGEMIQFANAKVQVQEDHDVTDSKGYTSRESKTLTLWSGLVALTSLKTTYPHSFKVISKDFSTTRDRAYKNDQSPIEYELESSIFTDAFDLTTTKEEPVKIRKQFSINNLKHFVDLKTETMPFVMSSLKGGPGVAFAFDSTTQGRNDMPLNVENAWKFFSNEEYAKQVLNDEFATLLHAISSIAGLVDDKFFKNDVKINK
ncbi:MAG: hypothetical protein KAG04_01150 [Mycoplasmataceae bacterium]|nr:hypothetical protein [Mycoplasmataceae bacterium]